MSHLRLTTLITLTSLITACAQSNSVNTETSNPPVSGTEISPGIPLPDDGLVPESKSLDGEQAVLASQNPPAKLRVVSEDIYTAVPVSNPEVIRYDRYTLVGSSPVGGQKYLLDQLVSVNMGKNYGISVEQGIWNTLQNTGFTLCSPTQYEVQMLFGLQLPKVHYKFGPMKLRDALQMLAGEAYKLTLNDPLRQVCFERRKEVDIPSSTPKIRLETVSGYEWRERD